MQVKLTDVGKVFMDHAVFKNMNLTMPSGYRGVVLGGNGSGKSTLLKVVSGALTPSFGKVSYQLDNKTISPEKLYKHGAFCAPYIDLVEEFTLAEHIAFQGTFKPFLPGLDAQKIIEKLYLKRHANKPIKTYSSGMRQRVRLALAILADVPLLLLDEPTSNLDPEGKAWYGQLLNDFAGNRTILVGSNHLEEEYFFADHKIQIADYK